MVSPTDPPDHLPPNLVNCKACDKPVSKTAISCPHCGQIIPGLHLRRAGVIVVCIIAFILLFLGIDKLVDIKRAREREAIMSEWQEK